MNVISLIIGTKRDYNKLFRYCTQKRRSDLSSLSATSHSRRAGWRGPMERFPGFLLPQTLTLLTQNSLPYATCAAQRVHDCGVTTSVWPLMHPILAGRSSGSLRPAYWKLFSDRPSGTKTRPCQRAVAILLLLLFTMKKVLRYVCTCVCEAVRRVSILTWSLHVSIYHRYV